MTTTTTTTTITPRRRRSALPPGQRLVASFPRFGVDLSQPPPAVPNDPVIAVHGAVGAPFDVSVATLADLPRLQLRADFHCVSGWSAADLDWEGVSFATFYQRVLQPAVAPGAVVSHLALRGLDGYRVTVRIEDALAADVLLADRLDGRPLDGNHGAPVRFLSPQQYGYMSAKHLSRIELCTAEPKVRRSFVELLLHDHPRARVWEEERHGFLPAWLVRGPYRLVKAIMLRQSARAEAESAPRRNNRSG